MSKFALISCMMLLPLTANSQSGNQWPQKSTNLSLSFTSIGGFYSAPMTFDFYWHKERFHHGITAGLFTAFYDRFRWATAGPMAGYTFMTGKGNNHFEFMAGGVILPLEIYGDHEFEEGEKTRLRPLANIGYRYQKPHSKTFFRVYYGITGLGIGTGFRIGAK